MKLYFAGAYGMQPDVLKEIGIKYKLYSFCNELSLAKKWGSSNLLLDSGAFSAYTQGTTVDIDKLIDFIRTFKPENSIQLDVLGNDETTWINYQYMSKYVKVLPVIHYKASLEHIERVFASSDYICLGGLVPHSTKIKVLTSWLDYIFSFKEARTKRLHCLGISNKTILMRYPFYSVDSTSALSIFRYPSDELREKLKQKTYTNKDLLKYAVAKQLELEAFITKLWTSRGITWKE